MEATELKSLVWMYTREISESTNNVLSPICHHNGLTLLQARILMALNMHEILTIGSLSCCICMAEANVSAMCKKLENEGLLQRFRDQDDERVVKVTLSGRGKIVVSAIDRELHEIATAALEEAAEIIDILQGLQKLNRLLQRMSFAAQQRRGE